MLFEWVRENEIHWGRGHGSFKDTKGKKALWQDKAISLSEQFPDNELSGEKTAGVVERDPPTPVMLNSYGKNLEKHLNAIPTGSVKYMY
jgi:hypothetical protein